MTVLLRSASEARQCRDWREADVFKRILDEPSEELDERLELRRLSRAPRGSLRGRGASPA